MWFFKRAEYDFYDCKNKKIEYIEYIEKENALVIKSKVGVEKIPTEGLKKVKI
jgi:hypothetical protein